MTLDVFLVIVITQVLSISLKTLVNTKEQKVLISMNFSSTENQIADIFTKALSREQFERNRLELGLIKTT